jgi:23S rRNA-/tRNA-specific pseudouridylate synthase
MKGGLSLLEVTLETGRTHQIRVHMTGIGHPVLGDIRYGIEGENAFAKKHF